MAAEDAEVVVVAEELAVEKAWAACHRTADLAVSEQEDHAHAGHRDRDTEQAGGRRPRSVPVRKHSKDGASQADQEARADPFAAAAVQEAVLFAGRGFDGPAGGVNAWVGRCMDAGSSPEEEREEGIHALDQDAEADPWAEDAEGDSGGIHGLDLEPEYLEDGPYEDPRLLEEADEELQNRHRFLHGLLSQTCSHRRRYHHHRRCPCCTKSGRTPLRNQRRCRGLGRRRWVGRRLGGQCGLPLLVVVGGS